MAFGSTFTEYVRSLGSGGEPPESESFEVVWQHLRQALDREMRRRQLRSAPPSFLGFYGAESWRQGDLFDELVQDCYLFIFIERLPVLKKRLKTLENIDGMVHRNIRNFLFEKQKKHDPVGYRVFARLRAALEESVASGEIFLLEGDRRIRNDTVLGFAPEHDPRRAGHAELTAQVEAWCDELLPELIDTQRLKEVVSRLRALVARLPGAGVEVFRFRDLLDPLKSGVQARWRALWWYRESREGGGGNWSLEERQSFEKRVSCMDRRLGELEMREKTRVYLLRLWLLLRWHIAELGEAKAPSDKKISERLDIPRGQVKTLRQILGREWERCLDDTREDAMSGSDRDFKIAESDAGASLDSMKARLRRRTGEAAARSALAQPGDGQEEKPPAPGDLFLFRETATFPMEWLVVERGSEDPRRLLVVPVDDHPAIGSRDIRVEPEETGGLTSVRCGVPAWLETARFETQMRTGTVGLAALDEVRRKLAEIEAGTLESSVRDQEVDHDPEYREWSEDVLLRGRAALLLGRRPVERRRATALLEERPVERRGTAPRRPKPWHSPYGIAASILLAVSLGLLAGLLGHRRDLAQVERSRRDLERRAADLVRDLERSEQERSGLAERSSEQERLLRELELRDQQRQLEIATLERDLERTALEGLQLNLPFVHFTREEPVRGPQDPLLLPPEARRLALIFEVAEPDRFARYRLQISEGATGTVVFRDDRLTRTASEISLDLPRSIFSTGRYELRIYGLLGREARLLEEYALYLRLE